MKTSYVLFVLCILFHSASVRAQIDTALADSLIRNHIQYYDQAGLAYFLPQSMTHAELLSLYQANQYQDPYNEFMEVAQSYISGLEVTTYRYRQHYKGVPVEPATVNVQVDNEGYVVWANGKIAELSGSATPTLNKMQALEALAVEYDGWTGPQDWAWEFPDLEDSLKAETGNPDTSYFPYLNGKLMWAVDPPEAKKMGFVVSQAQVRLAWRFELHCISPRFQHSYFVDAHTGEVYRVDDLSFHNGPVTTPDHGTRTIDTKDRGAPYNDFILKTDDDGLKIHTKYQDQGFWWSNPQITDDDDDWNTSEIDGTLPHWMVTESWLYYRTERDWDWMDGEKKRIRVYAQADIESYGAQYNQDGNRGQIWVGYNDSGDYSASLDIMGHEYTHGVILSRDDDGIAGINESGALHESFADIGGFMVERHVEGGVTDWILGEDAYNGNQWTRSMMNPKSFYRHFESGNCTDWTLGQPDTYEGDFWEFGTCDNGGIHINGGPQNHWFYLLSVGGSGTNDNNDTYTVWGIGIDDASDIAYYNMLTADQFVEYDGARANSIAIAQKLWGACSEQQFECARAWHAVGVGDPIECEGLGIDQKPMIPVLALYPNPSSNSVTIESSYTSEFEVSICSISGATVWQGEMTEPNMNIDISKLNNGVFIVYFRGANYVKALRLVKQ